MKNLVLLFVFSVMFLGCGGYKQPACTPINAAGCPTEAPFSLSGPNQLVQGDSGMYVFGQPGALSDYFPQGLKLYVDDVLGGSPTLGTIVYATVPGGLAGTTAEGGAYTAGSLGPHTLKITDNHGNVASKIVTVLPRTSQLTIAVEAPVRTATIRITLSERRDVIFDLSSLGSSVVEVGSAKTVDATEFFLPIKAEGVYEIKIHPQEMSDSFVRYLIHYKQP